MRFLGFFQHFFVVVKEIALTNVFDVNTCKTFRKTEKEELLEVLEGPVVDENLGLTRVFVKSVVDGTSGWVTVKGNQGTPFLREVEKSFYACQKEIALQSKFKSDAGEGGIVRTLKEDEILELLEGPREEEVAEVIRARVKASKDDAQGWVTLKDKSGTALAEMSTTLYTCKASVAITDIDDIRKSKLIGKLACGDTFEVIGDLKDLAGITRARGKDIKGGMEGWLTLKGNAGTVFAEPISNHYCVRRELELQKRLGATSTDTIRTLEVGETFQVFEGPTSEKVAPDAHVKVRALSDKAVGWVANRADTIKKWTPMYRCLVPSPVQDTRGATEVTKTLRELAKGEPFELLVGPVEELQELRMFGRAPSDGLTGWVTLKAENGTKHFEC